MDRPLPGQPAATARGRGRGRRDRRPAPVAGSRTLGAIVFRFAARKNFADGTGDLAVRLAEQGAQALDRALAWDRDRRSREALERGQGRQAFLVRASDILGAGADLQAAVGALPAVLVPSIADWCAIELLEQDASGLSLAAAPGCEDVVRRLATMAPRSLGSWLARDSAVDGPTIVATGEAAADLVADRRLAADALPELGHAQPGRTRSPGSDGESIGSIVLGSADPARFGPDDLALVRDVAVRIAAAVERASLFAAVTRFKATVDVSADAVYMFDPVTLRLTYVNRGGADLLGSTRRRSWHRRAGPPAGLVSDAVPARARRPACGARPSTTYTEVLPRSRRTADPGRRLPAGGEPSARPDPRGILTARDISDRIDVQARLARIAGDERRQAAELRAVIQSMGDGVLVVDPDGAISLANDAASTVPRRGPRRLGLAEHRRARWPARRLSAAATSPATTRPGSHRPARGRALARGHGVSGRPGRRDRRRGPTSRIVVLRDVTRAREAEAAREAFLGVLSHELRTPVTTIFGYAKVLQRPTPARRPGASCSTTSRSSPTACTGSSRTCSP